MATREERIANLAASLKASGLARSDSQARMMAEDMVNVEDNVQKRFDEEHGRAQEYLKTAKNLGDPRVKQPAEQPKSQMQEKRSTSFIEPISTARKPAEDAPISSINPRKDSESHGTSLQNLMLGQINADGREAKTIEQIHEEKQSTTQAPTPNTPSQLNIEAPTVNMQPKPAEDKPAEPAASPALDAKRLVDLMEEDGKLEEHTREIKEKPKNVKPKEEYAENNIDLANMFNFQKR